MFVHDAVIVHDHHRGPPPGDRDGLRPLPAGRGGCSPPTTCGSTSAPAPTTAATTATGAQPVPGVDLGPDPLDTTFTVDYAYLRATPTARSGSSTTATSRGCSPGRLAGAAGRRRLRGQGGPGGALGAGTGQLRAVRRRQAERVRTRMKLIGRRRAIWDYLAGALGSPNALGGGVPAGRGGPVAGGGERGSPLFRASPSRALAEGPARSCRGVVDDDHGPGRVFALTIVALRSPRPLLAVAAGSFDARPGDPALLSIFVAPSPTRRPGCTRSSRAPGRAFVPGLAVWWLALALASVGVLIDFIHHPARSIQMTP